METQSSEQMLENARHAIGDFTQRIDLKGRVDAHPIGMVALAFGVGYVLAGGLFSRFTGGLLKLGLRAAVVPALKLALVDRANVLLKGGDLS